MEAAQGENDGDDAAERRQEASVEAGKEQEDIVAPLIDREGDLGQVGQRGAQLIRNRRSSTGGIKFDNGIGGVGDALVRPGGHDLASACDLLELKSDGRRRKFDEDGHACETR